MVFTRVDVTIHKDGSGHTQEFDDYADGNKFYNFGVQTLAALKAHKTIDIHYPEYEGEPEEEIIIPYHAVLSWSATKEEGEYTKPEDDFCKSESTPTGDMKTLYDGALTFAPTGDGRYKATVSIEDKGYDAESITVTYDGETYILPHIHKGNSDYYGEGTGPAPSFANYPVFVEYTGCQVVLAGTFSKYEMYVPAAARGEHTIKLEVPNSSEVECG